MIQYTISTKLDVKTEIKKVTDYPWHAAEDLGPQQELLTTQRTE